MSAGTKGRDRSTRADADNTAALILCGTIACMDVAAASPLGKLARRARPGAILRQLVGRHWYHLLPWLVSCLCAARAGQASGGWDSVTREQDQMRDSADGRRKGRQDRVAA